MNLKNIINTESLSFRILTRVLLITVSLFVLTLSIYYIYTRNLIKEAARENAVQLAGNIAGKIAQQLQPMEKLPQMVSATIEMGLFDKDSLIVVLETILKRNPNIYGASIAFAPNIFPEKGLYFMPYVYRNNNEIISTFLGSADYEYFLMDWFQIPFMTKKPYWSEPYFDEGGGNALMTTYSVPFYYHTEQGRVQGGIATIDVDLQWLTDIVSEVTIFETGYAFVLSRNGMAITHPDRSMIMNESIFSNSENWEEPLLREIGRDLQQGNSSFSEYNLKNKVKRWIYYTPLDAGGLSLAVVYPDDEMFASLHKMNLILLALIIFGLILLNFTVVKIVNRLARPLVDIAKTAHKIAEGNFNAPLPEVKSRDEIRLLRNAFVNMQQELGAYVANLTATTAAKEKIESELRIARDIQLSMIPHSFPPFPELPQIDLFAELKSAKEVGGDLYDFFLIDKHQFCFAIGDVSGKGVPASLFMAVTRTLLRSIADKVKTPSGIMKLLNNSLAMNNESCMFVTFFLGVLDISTGELSYVNAGHNPPVIIPGDGAVKFLPLAKGIPLGLQENYEYPQFSLSFKNGDKFFAYTDGVSEAENSQHQLFGEQAILDVLMQHKSDNPIALIKAMDAAISQHVSGFDQSDDITMLSIAFNHGSANGTPRNKP
ncbi:MAG: SpoIIE family protein phosphatase [Bacteroidetes bacterium]|jgi:sigma-B regulation protein RsbU (phosphoserine phosphatase)|nr:SpoIIE family protein phosphatase [Bacteroidota bacterium]